jgi:hypothetical protein
VVDVLVNVKQRRTESNICCALGSKKACDVTRDTESSNVPVPDTAALKQYNFINLPQPQYPTRPPPLIFLISLKQSVSSRTRQQGILLIDTQAQAKQQTARKQTANSKLTAKKSRLVDILCETTTILKVQCYNTMKNKNNYSFFVSI